MTFWGCDKYLWITTITQTNYPERFLTGQLQRQSSGQTDSLQPSHYCWSIAFSNVYYPSSWTIKRLQAVYRVQVFVISRHIVLIQNPGCRPPLLQKSERRGHPHSECRGYWAQCLTQQLLQGRKGKSPGAWGMSLIPCWTDLSLLKPSR
jgi:hypothetical protein